MIRPLAADLAAGRAARNGDREASGRPSLPACVSAREFAAVAREPLKPYVSTPDGRTVLLARETTLLGAGPSGLGKSLIVCFDLAGRLAAPEGSDWLGLRVCGGLRVLLLSFEGSDEDTAERIALLPQDARDRFSVWDRWRGADLPAADEAGLRLLADEVRRLSVDVLVIDTASAFFGAAFNVDRGEEAHDAIERLRALSGRRLACIAVAHTRKRQRTATGPVDELEEVSGTFARKADAAVVIRRAADDEDDPHRRVTFPKVRRGRQLAPKLATFPTEPDALPRLRLIGDVGRPVKDGTEAEAMAEWIEAQETPVAAGLLCAKFGLSETTLRRRRPELEDLGVARGPLPGPGKAQGYGTLEQWRRATLGEELAP